MDVSAAMKNVMSLHRAIVNADASDVSLTYKGTSAGVSKPFITRVGSREYAHETYDGSISGLLALLKKELADKVRTTQQEAARLQQTLSAMDN